jgi:FkbM family methyltransferase
LFKIIIKKDVKIVHCGAGHAEEAPFYNSLNAGPVIWIELNRNLIPKIKENLASYNNQKVIQAALWSEDGLKKTFWSASNLGSSSFLKPLEHLDVFPDVQFSYESSQSTTRLDSLLRDEIFNKDLLVLDLQGAERNVLLGAQGIIDGFGFVYSEFQLTELYENGTYLEDIKKVLGKSFSLLIQNHSQDKGYGNALFVKDISYLYSFLIRLIWGFLKTANQSLFFVKKVKWKLRSIFLSGYISA